MIQQVFSARDSADTINKKLGELKGLDNVIEGKLKQANLFLIIAIVAAVIIGIICFISVINSNNSAGCALFFVLAILIVTPVAVYRSVLQGQDLENRKIFTGMELFSVLGQDIPAKAQCSLDIDFQGYRKHGKLLNKKTEGIFGSIRIYEYEDSWFSASGKLHDGNDFKISIDQSVKRKEKSKRKYTKVAESFTERVKLAIKIDEKTYPGFGNLPQYLAAGVSVADLVIQKADLVNSTFRLSATSPLYRRSNSRYGTGSTGDDALVTGKKLIALFIHVYRHLQQCR